MPGYNPRALAGTRVGIFVGAEPTGFVHQTFTGSSDAIVASRLSYQLNLKGPAIVVNTGCSSSGVAIHLACESLRHGESSVALAGGVFAAIGAGYADRSGPDRHAQPQRQVPHLRSRLRTARLSPRASAWSC